MPSAHPFNGAVHRQLSANFRFPKINNPRSRARSQCAVLAVYPPRRIGRGIPLARVARRSLLTAGLGDTTETFAWLRRAVETHDPLLVYNFVNEPLLKAVQAEPAWRGNPPGDEAARDAMSGAGYCPSRARSGSDEAAEDETLKEWLPLSREPLPLLGSNQDSPDPEGPP